MDIIVAADRNWAIGKGGDQFVRIPADLRRFRVLTDGHPVILGRRTLATLPGGRPLPDRRNLLLSRDPDFHPEGAEVFRDLDALLSAAPANSFVIGGGSVYAALLDRCDTAYVTKLDAAWPADTWFPDLDARPGWTAARTEGPFEHEGLRYHYITYRKTK